MGDDIEDLLVDHYRRRAEDIVPDPALLDRCRRARRPARAWPVRPGPLAAAAAVALVVLAGCLLWRTQHATVPAVRPSPPGGTPAMVTPTPSRIAPQTATPSPERPPRPRATPSARPPTR
jgi:negative regulator of sigma E activity